MSRSNPSEHLVNPSTRWFEWNGEKGEIRYYDKDAKTNIDVPLPFSFMLLDELATVRGWNKASDSGIYSNEVKDTTQDVLVVKSFKGGSIAEGKYRDIKDAVKSAGGAFNANCYIAYKDGDDLRIGSLRMKGAALGTWMEFRKANRTELYKKAIKIGGYTEGKNGKVVFRMPLMTLQPISGQANAQAESLDAELQEFLKAYLNRNKKDQAEAVAEQPAHHVSDEEFITEPPVAVHVDEIPFAWLMPLVLPALATLGMLA